MGFNQTSLCLPLLRSSLRKGSFLTRHGYAQRLFLASATPLDRECVALMASTVSWDHGACGVVLALNARIGQFLQPGAVVLTAALAPASFTATELASVPVADRHACCADWQRVSCTASNGGCVREFHVQVRNARVAPPLPLCFHRLTLPGQCLALQKGDILPCASTPLAELAPCEHPQVYGRLCTVCASLVQPGGQQSSGRAATGAGSGAPGAVAASMTFHARNGHQLTLSASEAQRGDALVRKSLLSRRLLELTLDIDHTLVHSTCDKRAQQLLGKADLEAAPIHSFQVGHHVYFTKERPGLKAFLTAASKHFRLQVDTAGTRPYAEAVLAAIDPKGEFFGSPPRLVARTDSSMRHKQASWLHSTLLDDSMVMALDDTQQVWKGSSILLQVVPYKFFQDAADVNNAAGESLQADPAAPAASGEEGEQPPPQGVPTREEVHPHLQDALRIFNSVHAAFYAGQHSPTPEQYGGVVDLAALADKPIAAPPSAAALPENTPPAHAGYLLQRLCQTVLEGCTLVFSGIVPLGVKPQREPLYRRAVAFGARIVDTVTPDVTHVVCRTFGTAKSKEAVKLGHVHVVSMAWLQHSLQRYQRQPEAKYSFLKAPTPLKPHPTMAAAKQLAQAAFDDYLASMLAKWRSKFTRGGAEGEQARHEPKRRRVEVEGVHGGCEVGGDADLGAVQSPLGADAAGGSEEDAEALQRLEDMLLESGSDDEEDGESGADSDHEGMDGEGEWS